METLPEYVGLMTNVEDLVLTENLFSGQLPNINEDLKHLKLFVVSGKLVEFALFFI